jgi:ParB family chromosome partitioning protein
VTNQPPKRLGRGLEALLGRPAGESAPGSGASGSPASAAQDQHSGASASAADASAQDAGARKVAISSIETNPFQPRRDFDAAAIAELSASIQEHGLLQPLIVRRHGDKYQLIAGERRLRAAMKAGWTDVPVHLHEADDRQMAELAIVENLQRKDLNALEKAASFQQYLEQYQCTQEELAGRLKIDRSTIANLIRLLELPDAVQDCLRSGAITPGHARALLPLGDEREQMAVCKQIQAETLSVRAVEELVHQMVHSEERQGLNVVGGDAKPSKARARSRQIAALEQELRTALGTKVELKQTTAGRGKIVVHFTSADEFERIRDQIVAQAPRLKVG